MKNYKLLKEHDSHFDLEHDKQGAFVVAKYGLDDATIKKIRSLGAARYAEGTKDAQGVKPSDAPGLMLAPEDQGTQSTDRILAPWREPIPTRDEYVTAPQDENMQIAQAMRAREEGLVPTRRTKGVTLPPGGDIIDLSPALQDIGAGKWKSKIDWTGDDTYREDPVAWTLAKERGEPQPQDKLQKGFDFVESDLGDFEPLQPQAPAQTPGAAPGTVSPKPKTSEPKGLKDDFEKTVEGIKENLDVLGKKFIDIFSKKEDEKPVPKDVLQPKTSEPKGIKDDFQSTIESVKGNIEALGKKFEDFFTPQSGQEPTISAPTSVQDDLKKSYEAIKNNFNFLLEKSGMTGTPAAKPGVTIAPDISLEMKAPATGGPLPYQVQTKKGLTAVPGTAPTATQLAGSGRPGDPLKAGEEAFQGLKQANLAIGKIEAQKELDSGGAQLAALKRMRELDDKYQQNLKNIDEEQKKLTADVANFKIDPNRVYAKMSSGNRILAAISLVLGGIGQGLLGLRSNPAMDVINDTIDRDIDAQKATLGVKQSLLALNLEKYKRLDAATAATRAQLLTVVQAQIGLAATKANTGLAVKNAQIANYKLDMEKAKLNQSLATQATMGQVLNTQEGIPAEYVMRLPEDVKDVLVRVPDLEDQSKPGKFFPAISKKAAEEANQGLTSVSVIKDILTKSEALFDKGLIEPWNTADKGRAESYDSQLLFEIKNIAGLGVLSAGDIEIVNQLKPDLKAWTFRDREKAKLAELRQYIQSKVNSFLKQRVPNYSPGNIIEERVTP